MASINGDSYLHMSCKRVKPIGAVSIVQEEAEDDRLSALPDCLLHHIFSFLDTKQVMMTCLLSKRWQFFWTDLSILDMRESSSDTAKINSFVDLVGRTLVMCSGIYLNKFVVDFIYHPCFASNVNLWVQYVIKNKVKDITLTFGNHFTKDNYMLPQMLFSCSSLKSLTIRHCVMDPLGAIAWGSLKSLSLANVKLSDCLMEKISSGCPVLKVLRLIWCYGLHHLNICSPNITTLVIEYWILDSVLEITSPYVQDMSLKGSVMSFKGSQYRLKDVSSLVRAYLDFKWTKENALHGFSYANQLLKSLQSIKELHLGSSCIKVLSVMEMMGWRPPPSTLKNLTLNPSRHKITIHGILGILKYSPIVESLLIEGNCLNKEIKTTNIPWDLFQNDNLDSIALHLKTVKIVQFIEPGLSGEPMLTLVRILLERAKVLEKIVIVVEESIINKLARTLLSFPRASHKAVVLFS